LSLKQCNCLLTIETWIVLKLFGRSFFLNKNDVSKIAVLFVCRANYCRSPMAEGMLNHTLLEQGLSSSIRVDSAGTHVSRNGQQPDLRAHQAVLASGVDLTHLRSRAIKAIDFIDFDYILAMDSDNYRNLVSLCPDEYQHKIALIMSFSPQAGVTEVPDPYYSNKAGFAQVYTFLKQAIDGLVSSIDREHGLARRD